MQDFELDLYIEVTNAPGLSAYNKAERRMFPLSKALTGVVLPHDTYGSHLDNAGKTIDAELEMKNFEAAGETLCSLWNELEIDGFKVVAEYIKEPPDQEIQQYVASAEFRRDHVFETQYMTVYMKCKDPSCCSPFITDVEVYFPHRRIPALIPIKRTSRGIEALNKSEVTSQNKFEFLSLGERVLFEKKLMTTELRDKYGDCLPYDAFFPTVLDKLEKRICKKCKKYHATIKSLAAHKRICKENSKKRTVQRVESSGSESELETHVGRVNDSLEVLEDEEAIDEHEQPSNVVDLRPKFSVAVPGEFVEQILNLKEWLKSPWAVDDNNNDS